MKRFYLLIPCLVVMLIAGAGCHGGSGDNANTIRIGVVTSLTGSNAAFGQAHKNAALGQEVLSKFGASHWAGASS